MLQVVPGRCDLEREQPALDSDGGEAGPGVDARFRVRHHRMVRVCAVCGQEKYAALGIFDVPLTLTALKPPAVTSCSRRTAVSSGDAEASVKENCPL